MAIAAIALRNKRQISKVPPLKPSELPNGKNAWKGGSEANKPSRRRIAGKNKIGDSNITTEINKIHPSQNKQSGVVNVLLYVGFILVTLGLIMTFVGTGERGFKTEDLKLIGPSLIGSGILFALLRILFCSLPKSICEGNKPLDEKSLLSPSIETLAERPSSPLLRPPKTLPPIRNVPRHENTFTVSEISEPEPQHNPLDEDPDMPSVTEDEVESDTDLGLELDYVEEQKSDKSSRKNSKGSLRQIESVVENVDENTSISNEINELVLDPTKLSDEKD